MSFLLKLDPRQRKAGRFIGRVRDEIIKAFFDEKKARGLTQEQVARALEINRSQINRILKGDENLTLRTVADLAWALDREIVFHFEKAKVAHGQNHFDEPSIQTLSSTNWPSSKSTVTESPANISEFAL
jgi:transcriptional regulator with XRE-family HTH domain